MKIKRPQVRRSCDDWDDEDDWFWMERGDTYELPTHPRPKPRSVSSAAHLVFETQRAQREKRPIGFHRPKA